MPKARLAEARAILRELIDTLDAREAKGATAKARLAAIRACVQRFNAWNDEHGLIETAEREALHETLCDVAHAAGLGDQGDAIDRWRDW
jgi:hypothetical protein